MANELLLTQEAPLFVEVTLSKPEEAGLLLDCGGCATCASCASCG